MGKQIIFSVGKRMPGDDFEYIPFQSERTLLDADIAVYHPVIPGVQGRPSGDGKFMLTDESYSVTSERLQHWKDEIEAALDASKLVIVYLTTPTLRYYDPNRSNIFGNVGNRIQALSSYDALPNIEAVQAKSGTSVKLASAAEFLRPYWNMFSTLSPYQVVIDRMSGIHEALITSSGDRVVGGIGTSRGTILFLPPVDFASEADPLLEANQRSSNPNWSPEAIRLGKELAACLVELRRSIRRSQTLSPVPSWVADSTFRLQAEKHADAELAELSKTRQEVEDAIEKKQGELDSLADFRHLLYEQGDAIEAAVRRVLTIMGFDVEHVVEGDSEFDAVFTSPEGRCLGEVEGKDNKAVDVKKISQLHRNITEDFSRDNISQPAKGVLFGNAYRLKPLDERGDCFTDKCHTMANQIQAALVPTSSLYFVAKHLVDNPADTTYAQGCREAIFASKGGIVQFPTPVAGLGTETTSGRR